MQQFEVPIQFDPTLFPLTSPGVFTDTISAIDGFLIDNCNCCFGVSSWDCTMKAFIATSQQTQQPSYPSVQQVCEQKIDEPITTLCTAGQYFAFGTASGKLGLWDVKSNELFSLHTFEDAVTAIKFSPELKSIIATSLDGNIVSVDVSTTAKTSLKTDMRINCMDTHTEYIGYSSPGKVEIFNIYAGKVVTEDLLERTQYRTNCSIQTMAFFPDKKGIINCGVTGKADVVHFERKDAQHTFTFKAAHKKLSGVHNIFYPINAVSFYNENTFLTAGSDGIIYVWDKSTKSRVNQINAPDKNVSITTAKFICNSQFLAFSTGYDYHMGCNSVQSTNDSIPYIKILQNDDILKTMSFKSKK